MNPMLQMLQQARPAQPMSDVLALAKSIKSGNTDAIYQNMMQNNPQFRSFVEQNRGKSIEQIAGENGVDMGVINSLLR